MNNVKDVWNEQQNENHNTYMSITLKSKDNSHNPFLKFLNTKKGFFEFILKADTGIFEINQNKFTVLEVREGEIVIYSELISANNVDIENDIQYMNKQQWKLIHIENFNSEPQGWTDNSISECGITSMLGGYGYFAGGEVQKTFEDISEHTKLKIEAKYHFIDKWNGETGFMRATSDPKSDDLQYLWAKKLDSTQFSNSINLCGSEHPEVNFQESISVYIPHSKPYLTLEFGSTLSDDPLESSFGVSSVEIYIM